MSAKNKSSQTMVPQSRGIRVGTQVQFKDIDTPGAYVDLQTGNLFRFDSSSLRPGNSPTLWIESTTPQMLVKIDDDPSVANNQARLYCGSHNIPHNIPSFATY